MASAAFCGNARAWIGPRCRSGAAHAAAATSPTSLCGPAGSAPALPELLQSYRYELQAGGFAHGVGGYEQGSFDLNPELVLPRLPLFQDQWWSVFVPRPHAGGLINLDGRTSAALCGRAVELPAALSDVFPSCSWMAPGTTAIQNPPPGRAGLGCPYLFHVGGSIGYAITEHWTAMVTFDHLSDGHYIFGISVRR